MNTLPQTWLFFRACLRSPPGGTARAHLEELQLLLPTPEERVPEDGEGRGPVLGLRADHCRNQLSRNELVWQVKAQNGELNNPPPLHPERERELRPSAPGTPRGRCCGEGSHRELRPPGSSAGRSPTGCWPGAASCPQTGAAHLTPRSRRRSRLRRCPQRTSAKNQGGGETLAAKGEGSFRLPAFPFFFA